MKVFSKEEFGNKLAVPLEQFVTGLTDSLMSEGGSYRIPADSGAKTGLAKLLANVLLTHSDVTIWITGWSIWQSAEHPDLFYGYRKSRGEKRTLMEAPVHFFDNDTDKPAFVSIVSLILYFVWDAKIFDQGGTFLIVISNDEFIDVYGAPKEVRAIKDGFSSFGIQPCAVNKPGS